MKLHVLAAEVAVDNPTTWHILVTGDGGDTSEAIMWAAVCL